MPVGNKLTILGQLAETQSTAIFVGSIILNLYVLFFLHPLIALGIFAVACIICRKLAAGGKCPPIPDQTGKVVIVTGSNTGLGKETAATLAAKGAKVILACRDEKKSLEAAADIRKIAKLDAASENVKFMKLDLSDLDSVRQFVKEFEALNTKLDILINNAGIMTCPFGLTKQQFESQFGTNHLGHFLLTVSLLPKIKEAKGRIVTVSSLAHTFPGTKSDYLKKHGGKVECFNVTDEKKYDKILSYGWSKLANVLFTIELQRRLADSGATAYTLHPGFVRTELSRYLPVVSKLQKTKLFDLFGSLFSKTPNEGAQTSLFCATQPNLIAGEYYTDCALSHTTDLAQDVEVAAELWKLSEELTKAPAS